jgi:hypothetical protein
MNDEVGERNFFTVGDLRCDAAACIGIRFGARGCIGKLCPAVDITGDAKLDGSSNEDDTVETPLPARRRALLVRLENKGGLNDSDSVRIFGKEPIGPFLLGGDYGRVHDTVQFGEAVLAKGTVGEETAIKSGVGTHDIRPELRHDCVVNNLSGRHKIARDCIGVNNVGAEGTKDLPNGGFPAS